jgi:hypothetical protein
MDRQEIRVWAAFIAGWLLAKLTTMLVLAWVVFVERGANP